MGTSEENHEPAADADAMVVYNVVRTNAALSPYLDAALKDLHLTGAQMNTLLVLRDAGPEGLPLTEVGRRLVVTKANVTGLMDRLERQELIRRDSDAPDRRVIRACLTTRGAALLEAALPHRDRLLSDLLACLSSTEKADLIGLLTKLRRGL
ncbi:MAG: MarR family transcriptional regulator, partial [Cytophagales bacterium]|nr:MarR family transcriptional regulator [Armatimonadota bacterium]